jgi:hypothetical protein
VLVHGKFKTCHGKTKVTTLAEFSTQDVGVLVYAMQLQSEQEQPSLKLLTQPKQLLDSLQLAFCFLN